ncbi:hypothetical protein VTL71DRAFT_11319 [Oculimacula yallundae]|uniref:Mitochondrial transcription factor 1 n=1 Tax=Oculimacula yallundae TaxID=86028 RepID=A0ABR4CRF7_9HELO
MVPSSLMFRLFTTSRQAQFRSTKVLSRSFHKTAFLPSKSNPTDQSSVNVSAYNDHEHDHEHGHGHGHEESLESKAYGAQAFDDAVADIMNNVKARRSRTRTPPVLGEDGLPIQKPRASRTRKPPVLGEDGLPIKKPRASRARPPVLGADGLPVKKPRASRGRPPVLGEDGLPVKKSKTNQKKYPPKKPDYPNYGATEDARDHVKEYLRWARTTARRTQSKEHTLGDRRRMNIISEEACDVVLERLKPSLQKHMGCDIIDINPGAGVWSSKLHDLLKPRTHILLEPDAMAYGPLLDPLVSEPGSTYKLFPKSGLVWNHLEQVLSKEYLPHQTAWETGDPRLEEPNNTLLIVANLGYHPRKPYKGFLSLAQMVMYQLIGAIKAQSLVQKYGLARMLIWMDDEERHNVIPKALSAHRKPAIEADLVCEKLIEVASSTEETTRKVREPHLNFRSLEAVLQKMHDNGITIPQGRESVTAKELWDKDIQGKESSKPGMSVMELKAIHPNIKPKELAHHRWGGIVTEYENIFEELKEIYGLPESSNKTTRMADLAERRKRWDEAFKSTGMYGVEYVPYHCDSRLAFNRDKPLLTWDRRDYEPIRLYPEEFYPAHPMALIDVQPKPLHPILRKNFPQNYDIIEYFLTTFLVKSAQSVTDAFNHLVPGAHDYLVENCPTLKDPRKGGNPNLNEMSVRTLTDEMLLEMVEAWTRWPFRPSKYEILSRMGSSNHDTGASSDMYNEDYEMS